MKNILIAGLLSLFCLIGYGQAVNLRTLKANAVQGDFAGSRARSITAITTDIESGFYTMNGSSGMPDDPTGFNAWLLTLNRFENGIGTGTFWNSIIATNLKSKLTYIGGQDQQAGGNVAWQLINTGPMGIQNGGTANYTLQLSDMGKVVYMTNSGSATLTVPTGLPLGFSCQIVQNGAGTITTVSGSGCTVNSRGGRNKTAGQFAVATVYCYANNWFTITGDVIP